MLRVAFQILVVKVDAFKDAEYLLNIKADQSLSW